MKMNSAQGYNAIVAARDDLSRVSEGRHLRESTAKELSKFFWEEIFCRYGMIGSVVTDNGPEIKAAFQELMRRYGIPHIRISPYNSKANGVVERGHFIIRESILKACEGYTNRWPDYVHHAFFTDRITVSKSTGFSPYYLLYGQHPILPFDLFESTYLSPKFYPDMPTSELIALRIRQLYRKHKDVDQASQALIRTRLKSKEEFEERYKSRLTRTEYKEGDLVLLRNSKIEKSMDRKTRPRYLGPFQVVRRTPQGSYILRELDGAVWRSSAAAFRLLPYVQRTDRELQAITGEEDIGSDNEDEDDDTDEE